ncbi:MAG TPA: DUF882 domain-containing protein [Methyloceanibacter sp.]|nr:DUF882 domain-containing protein [Methyloceanibacter sp.]
MRRRGSVARRAVLGASFVAIAVAAWCAATAGRAGAGETRTLSLYEIHTKETLTVTYKRDGKYDEEALKKLNHFMRDWRADQETKMDPALIDLIWTLHKELGSKQPIHLISGYRSAATNASLRKKGGGQAKKSQHILGKAADIHFPDVPIKTLRNSALVQEVGGVGYYPTSGVPFVHVDTGHVRMWPRIPRLELAALFPSGKTKYLPLDGKPITPADYKLALAKGLVGKTMVASASPKLESAGGAIAEVDAAAETETARPVLAAYAPATAAVIADDPTHPGAPPPPQRLFTYANAGGLTLPGFGPKTPKVSAPAPAEKPSYTDAEVVSAPEADDDHPDTLSYVPFEIAGLMTDTSVTYSRTVAPLTHPDQTDLDYLFEDMERPLAFSLRPSSGYTSLAAAQRFSGEAVKNLYAELEPAASAPTRLAQSGP